MIEEQINVKILILRLPDEPGVLQKKNLLQVQVKIFAHDPIGQIPVLAHRVYLLGLENQSNMGLLES